MDKEEEKKLDKEIEMMWRNNKGHDCFMKEQLEKRGKFFEKVHAAFVLNKSLSEFGELTQSNLSWLFFAYPKSEINTGNDQGANYYTVTPKF